MTDLHDDILDAPEHHRPREKAPVDLHQEWALIASLTPEQVADLIPLLQAADLTDIRLEKETATLNHTGIIPVSSTQLGDMKTLLYVKPEDAEDIQAIVEDLPESTPSDTEVSDEDRGLYKLFMVLAGGVILCLLMRTFYQFMISF